MKEKGEAKRSTAGLSLTAVIRKQLLEGGMKGRSSEFAGTQD
jgi:hypothetical protein